MHVRPSSAIFGGFVLAAACFAQEPSLEQLLGDRFGNRQVEQMLEDRAEMQGVIPPSHPLAVWVTKAYAGEHIGRRIYWNADVVDRVFNAEHCPPSPGCLPYVWVTDRRGVSGIDKWASVIYELHNILNTDEFARLFSAASAGRLTAEQYASECVKLELKALRPTHELLKKHPLPMATPERDPWYSWVMDDDAVATVEWRESPDELKGFAAANYRYWLDHFRSSIPAAVR